MFSTESSRRVVNLSGKPKTQSRAELLEESKRQRAERAAIKKRNTDACRIQSVYRSYRIRKFALIEERDYFDHHLPSILHSFRNRHLTTENDSKIPRLHFLQDTSILASNDIRQLSAIELRNEFTRLISSFLFFYSRSVDADQERWKLMRSALCLSLEDNISNPNSCHIGSLLLASDNNPWTWSYQLSRFFQLLLHDIEQWTYGPTANIKDLHLSVMLLLRLSGVSEWTHVTQLSSTQTSAIYSAILQSLNTCFDLPMDTSQTRKIPNWHLILRQQLISLFIAVEFTNSRSTLLVDDVRNVVEGLCLLALRPAAIHARIPESRSPVTISFLYYIYSIPELYQRLLHFNLPHVYQQLFAPEILNVMLQAITTLNADRVAKVCTTTLYANSLLEENMKRSLDSTTPMEIDRMAVNHFDDDDEDSDEPKKQSPPAPKYICTGIWLLGNLIEAAELLPDSVGLDLRWYVSSLCSIIRSIPENSLSTIDIQYPLHGQLRKATSRRFITGLLKLIHIPQALSISVNLSSTLLPPEFLNDLSNICTFLDTLIYYWRSSRESILNVLSFSTPIIRIIWNSFTLANIFNEINSTSSNIQKSPSTIVLPPLIWNVIPLFSSTFAHLLPVLSDDELYIKNEPIPCASLSILVKFLVNICYQVYWHDWDLRNPIHTRMRAHISKLLTLLRDRQSRKPFCSPSDWTMTNLPLAIFEKELHEEIDPSSRTFGRANEIIQHIPFVLTFEERLRLFYDKIKQDKVKLGHVLEFSPGLGVRVRIRREHLLEDGYASLAHLGNRLKGLIQVEFIDTTGLQEAGVDGGGLLKEFIVSLAKFAFDPGFGMFLTNSEQLIYPNPDSLLLSKMLAASSLSDVENSESDDASGAEQLAYYRFIGMMIGKALYEGVQIEPNFAAFFLRKILGHPSSLEDLQSLDQELYTNLLKLRSFNEEELREMGLTFTLDRPILGSVQTIDLIPNGGNIAVDTSNVNRYVHVVSDWYLNKSIHSQCRAFQAGIHTLVSQEWLSMFTPEELSLLIRGSEKVNLADLRHNTVYASGYTPDDEVIQWFWKELEALPSKDHAEFLRFVTSCPRAPLVGFGALNPKFCIQRIPINSTAGDMALPTSATCMNLLRLPQYRSREQLRDRLRYAIQYGTGFGLT